MSTDRLALPALLASGERSFSFEFFPPKTVEGEAALWSAIAELEPLRPTFVSLTYGAGGSTRDLNVRVTGRIAQETSLTPVGHLTCVGATREEVADVIRQYGDAGVHNVLALRGDPQGGVGQKWEAHEGGMSYAADLVRLLAEIGGFSIGVAAFPEKHPEAATLEADALRLIEKFDAGAEFAVTQFFFEAEHYFALVERVRALGGDRPILPGIMPVTNVKQIERMAQLSGAAMPRWLTSRLHAAEDDPQAVRAIGVEVAIDLCRELLDGGAPGLHFYTLNRSTATREIYAGLGIPAL
ncbi:MAG: methylenetetrahydrofolate reductase [Frankiaceae bacterium]|nr:methylenetetrahydrofolate reductase [Frankiaceae bacterium]